MYAQPAIASKAPGIPPAERPAEPPLLSNGKGQRPSQ